jgi:hypothetical protein
MKGAVPLALILCAFVWAQRQDGIDRQEEEAMSKIGTYVLDRQLAEAADGIPEPPNEAFEGSEANETNETTEAHRSAEPTESTEKGIHHEYRHPRHRRVRHREDSEPAPF